MRVYKSVTAKELFRGVPGLRVDLWGGEFWSDGYYAATVGERGDWSVVEEYVRSQGVKRNHCNYGCFSLSYPVVSATGF